MPRLFLTGVFVYQINKKARNNCRALVNRRFHGKYVSPKVYDELEEITGLDRGTIKQFKSVSENTSLTRVNDLSYGHHREVAPLPAGSANSPAPG